MKNTELAEALDYFLAMETVHHVKRLVLEDDTTPVGSEGKQGTGGGEAPEDEMTMSESHEVVGDTPPEHPNGIVQADETIDKRTPSGRAHAAMGTYALKYDAKTGTYRKIRRI